MKLILTICCLSVNICIFAAEFTISSYNCGGLSDHYDYLRGAAMQKVMQERYNAEPAEMSLNEKIQRVALKILFSEDPLMTFATKWDQKYKQAFEYITSAPINPASPNYSWYNKANAAITPYNIRPIIINDQDIVKMLDQHIGDIGQCNDGISGDALQKVRSIMAARIFDQHLKYDIICLQEANYLDESMFPENYQVLFAGSDHARNGIVWNTNRFELINAIGDILKRALVVQLRDLENGKVIVVASGHITGCNPYRAEKVGATAFDSDKGDNELKVIIETLDKEQADLMLIGMDSNVTSLHPRLSILKNAGYFLDSKNYIEPTCTNPNLLLNTRIDWIAIKSKQHASIVNIPVMNVSLNNLQTNISDHKPIASKITY